MNGDAIVDVIPNSKSYGYNVPALFHSSLSLWRVCFTQTDLCAILLPCASSLLDIMILARVDESVEDNFFETRRRQESKPSLSITMAF